MLKRLMLFFVTFLFIVPSGFTYLSAHKQADSSCTDVRLNYGDYIKNMYNELGSELGKPDFSVFSNAITGFFILKENGDVDKNLITIIDFSLSSNDERLWIVDVNKMKIVHKSLVAHGRNSGELFAHQFSNIVSSYQSSLGFYLTSNIYYGKHGLSLLLDGMEPGINDKARERAIVMHSADYVSEDFIKRNGRLGRSHGCPAIPMVDHKKIINMIAGRSCLYIYHPDAGYHANSEMLIHDKAQAGMVKFFSESPDLLAMFPALPKLEEEPI